MINEKILVDNKTKDINQTDIAIAASDITLISGDLPKSRYDR